MTETGEFYCVASSVRKSGWTLVRQLRGPHLSTCAWCRSRSRKRGDGGGVAQQLPPVVDGSIRGEERGRALVAAHDDLQEIFGGRVRQLPHAEIVNDQDGHGREVGEVVLARALERGVGDLFEERVRFAVEDAVALLDRGAADRLREVALARARRPEEERVLALGDEAAGGEFEDERPGSSSC